MKVKCQFGNEAATVCNQSQCTNKALCCQEKLCMCHHDHLFCDMTNLSNIINILQKKKELNSNKIQQLSVWYDSIIDAVKKQKERMLKQSLNIVYSALDPSANKFLRYLEEGDSEEINQRLIEMVQQNLNTTQFEDKFDTFVDELKQMSTSVIMNRLERIPDELMKGAAGYPIHVKTLNGDVFDVSVPTTQSVSLLKKIIYLEKGYLQINQRLVYGGLQMSDNSPIHQYGVTQGTTINLVLRLYGQ